MKQLISLEVFAPQEAQQDKIIVAAVMAAGLFLYAFQLVACLFEKSDCGSVEINDSHGNPLIDKRAENIALQKLQRFKGITLSAVFLVRDNKLQACVAPLRMTLHHADGTDRRMAALIDDRVPLVCSVIGQLMRRKRMQDSSF